jgi:hypothetical protein
MDGTTILQSVPMSLRPGVIDLQRVFDYYCKVKDRPQPHGVRYPLCLLL